MKYIIMCGGEYKKWQKSRQLIEVNGEPIVARTIRLLREAGVKDIAISSDKFVFSQFGVPVLTNDNDYTARKYNDMDGFWCNCFYPTDEPACYMFGDVIFSPRAIKYIVDYKTDDIMLFGSKPPFSAEYPKRWIEPFAFKVEDQEHLHEACREVKRLEAEGMFYRKPIAWETWAVIHGGDPNGIDTDSYIGIDDYTCDIDNPEEVEQVLEHLKSSL